MITFSPKDRFLKNKEAVEAWRTLTNEKLLHTVLTESLAEMAWRNPTAEQLLGVNNFIAIFLNMAEPPVPAKGLPQKGLKSWDVKL